MLLVVRPSNCVLLCLGGHTVEVHAPEERGAHPHAVADLLGEEATRDSIVALREEIADLYRRVEESEASAELLPHRRRYLLLNMRFLRGMLDLHVEWIDEVERELELEQDCATG